MISWRVLTMTTLIALAGVSPAVAQAPPYRTFTPEGAGPNPAILFVAGCSGYAPAGFPPYYEPRAEELRGQGYLVTFVDPLGRRGLDTCAGKLEAREAAQDLLDAAAHVRALPSVDAKRIVAMGWSFGGNVVLSALGRPDGAAAFSRAVVMYPTCRSPLAPWGSATPVLMLLGGSDNVAPPAVCQQLVQRLSAQTRIEVKLYPGAHHGFDVPGLTKRQYPFGTVAHDAEAAKAAGAEIDRFLRE